MHWLPFIPLALPLAAALANFLYGVLTHDNED